MVKNLMCHWMNERKRKRDRQTDRVMEDNKR